MGTYEMFKMHDSMAVFLAVSVLYFVSLAMPFEYASKVAGIMAQGVTLTGAFGTFMVLKSQNVDFTGALAVFLALSVVSAIAVLSGVQCVPDPRQCKETVHLHAIIFTSAFTVGSAAYLGYVLASMAGFPLWAAIAISLVFAPMAMTTLAPLAMKSISLAVDKLA